VKGGPTMSDTLTKAHIINAVIEQNGFMRNKSIKTVETILEIIKRTMASGEDVLISGFGKFCIKQKKITNILQRTYKQGKIKRVGKGIYYRA
jgi:nucleoid DNA-binding protein